MVTLTMRKAMWAATGILGLVIAGGCSPDGPKLYPVKGQVFFDNQPAEGANVVLHSAQATEGPNALIPSGIVQADGSFTLRTHPYGDGAPPGEYKVVITWYPPDARELENPRSKLPAKYGNPARTPLTAVVKDGPTELEPFRISAK
ncbi:MAG: hypothetical protein RMJ56_10425 [Gemmataceae bacterium]|nr:hypothetical protein [Gemmata sp.]MDW8198005.1 hypothetical protein [Gemmataceae bacterium]